MCHLSVNINKLATIRNARGGDNPDLIRWAEMIQSYGAQGITIHPRPDERHIRRSDVVELKEVVHTEFNIEGFPSEDFMEMVLRIQPEQVTLVPDPPHVLTSNAGWDVISRHGELKPVIDRLREAGIRSSIFMDTDLEQMVALSQVKPDRVELYTQDYAEGYAKDREAARAPYVEAAKLAKEMGMGVNAGHDLDLSNLRYLYEGIPFLEEVSIGHALICDALLYGMDNTVKLYLRELR
ncbi:MAG: pyridoxine 5'-phosphate synthase [Bacteroidetes bacterium]|jgi:pyridoxine 5-phosphate synthase|nr:pyridoxine 5'-phosphate synthase [Bacteroidota bacterium]MDA0973813.1 pyridoxine 5'-phosphate synthase [Bacteroidota bacterium]